jgi:Second Messenger Oligonucleotide or Dinucleotide Synthetase domain
MSAVDKAFAAYDESLNLDPAIRRKAQGRHHEIRQVLADAGLVRGSFLQGSFARKTMLKPLKDVDIVCLLAERYRDQLMTAGGPRKALEMFRDAVAAHWPDAGFDEEDPPAAKALRVSFPDCDFTVDLVAAFDTDKELVLIGDRDDDEWKPSTTRRLIHLIATRNQETDGKFVHQVRIIKTLKHQYEELRDVSGIVFESLAYSSVFAAWPHKKAVAVILEHAAVACEGPIHDPAHENDLTENWSSGERAGIVRAFMRLAERARRALAFDADGDPDAALDLWHSIFGYEFPAPDPRSPKDVMSAWAVGSLTPTGRPSTSTAGNYQVSPGRGWLAS